MKRGPDKRWKNKRTYEIIVKLDRYELGSDKPSGVVALFRGGGFVHSKLVQAKDRGEAVSLAVNWFWLRYRRTSAKKVHELLEVSNPFDEVNFVPRFRCHDPMNKYLSESEIGRVIEQSKGLLERDTKIYANHHPPASLRWGKKGGDLTEGVSNARTCRRRRDLLRRAAPSLYRTKAGSYFFRIATQRQKKSNRRLIRRRKIKYIRLESKNPRHAAEEVIKKELWRQNKSREAQRQLQKLKDWAKAAASTGW